MMHLQCVCLLVLFMTSYTRIYFLYGQVESFTCIVVVCLCTYSTYRRIYFLYGQVELFTCIVFK